ncbi:sulfur carrier protein ThiS [Geomicrobium sp. JCM 19055]|uniref:sulfur carrier protein ThiS n=1 Tax=Geomicrobium sp. JCM 19055 TaxID=1460649 RepID=UPI00045ED38C|nr:sulfur carrier protein ThiS [Geomicrobium sp. JCM 19055]GAK00769.1 hypothetical protein JCM19055_3883 [Geomicrobium sp. JCM 19055]
MNIIINQKNHNLPDSISSIQELRSHFNLLTTNVMIEHNGVALTADQQGQIQLESGDKIEIVRFVGGG